MRRDKKGMAVWRFHWVRLEAITIWAELRDGWQLAADSNHVCDAVLRGAQHLTWIPRSGFHDAS